MKIDKTPKRAAIHLLAATLLSGLLLASPATRAAVAAEPSDATPPPAETGRLGAPSLPPLNGAEPDADAAEQIARQRQMMVTMMQVKVSADDVITSMSGMAPSEPRFPVVKAALLDIFNDNALMLSIAGDLQPDDPDAKAKFMRSWMRRLASGMNRLDDDGAMNLLRPIGQTLGSFSKDQCTQYMTLTQQHQSGQAFSHYVLPAMSAVDIKAFYSGLHQALLADLNKRPLRALPDRAHMADAIAAIEKIDPRLKSASNGSSCETSGWLMAALEQVHGPQRSDAVTMVMTMAGFYAQGVR